MNLFWWILGAILGIVWLHRLIDTARGIPRIADITQPQWDREWRPGSAPRVTIVVPARNEEEHLEAALRSLLALDYPDCEIIAVNDRSTDRTGEILDGIAAKDASGRLRVMHVRELPAGWLGKTHAMWAAAERATGDWILFTDADVIFQPDALRHAITYAEDARADHLVVFPTHIFHTVGERMMVAFFQILFVFGHRAWKVPDPEAKDHIGIGAFNLVRRPVYQAIGTYAALRMQVVDDMKLGELIKQHRYAQRTASGPGLVRVRWARGAMGVVDNLTKNVFAVMLFRWYRALGAAFLLALLNLGPFVGLLFAPGWTRIGYAVATAVIALMYVGMWLHAREIWPVVFFLHPVSTVLYVYILLRSTFLTLWRGGVLWRGTMYPLHELRKGMA
jgi:glycosyltransferase involved in cell wall biosynthesis